MPGTDPGGDANEQVVHHLDAALDADTMEDTNYHVRQALQLLHTQE